MKKPLSLSFVFIGFFLFIEFSFAGIAGPNRWQTDPFNPHVFIKNNGQFTGANLGDTKDALETRIHYGFRANGVEVYFTSSGITFRHDVMPPLTEEQRERIEQNSARGKSKDEKKLAPTPHFLKVKWVGANTDAEIIGEGEAENYFTYSDLSDPQGKSTITTQGFRKITYKNIYPHTDIEYIFPKNKEGIKYNIVLHPGADVQKIKMKYTGAKAITADPDGNIVIASDFGNFIDHAPVAFEVGGKKINCLYAIDHNTISFRMDNYDSDKTIVIDPWTTIPTFSGINNAYDVDWDFQGNVYIYGGTNPFQLIKLNNSGVIQWTFTTTVFNSSGGVMYGDFAIDRNTGTSYICEGINTSPGARLLKVNTLGNQAGLFGGETRVNEFTRIAFNSCTKKAVVALGNTQQTYQIATFDTNMTSITPVNALSTSEAFHDIALLALDDTNCYIATSISLQYIPNFNNVTLKVPVPALFPPSYILSNGHAFQEYTLASYVSGGIRVSGFNGMAKSRRYLYTYDGSTLKKWNPKNGAFIKSAAIGGTTFMCGGIVVDACENIYLGGTSSVFKYDSALTLINTSPTTAAVFDLALGTNGEIYASGAAFVSSINSLNACPPNGNNNIVTTATSTSLCVGTNATLTASGGSSYSWSTGSTTPSIIVAPSVTTTYTVIGYGLCLGVDTNTVTIYVGPPVTPSVSSNTSICSGALTTLSASGGASFYWSTGATTSSIVVSPASSATYSVTIANGACAYTGTVSVNVTPTPVITTVPPNPAICIGNSIQMNILYQLGCGTHGTVCSGPTSVSQLGTTTTFTNANSTTPFAAQTNSAKFQYLYTASELAVSGMNQPTTIKELGFSIQQLLGMSTYQNFTIKMGCTSANSLTASFINGLSVVYTPKTTPALSAGVNYFVLDNAYDWDGASNIIVEICFNNTTASSNSFVYYTTTAFNSVTYASGTSVCTNNTGTVGMNRPTAYFKHCNSNGGGGFTYSWSPASTLNNSTIANPVATPTVTTTYTLTVTHGPTLCVTIDTVTVYVGVPFTLSSSNDTTICQTSGIQLSTVPAGGNGAYSYSWTPSSSLSNPNISNPVATPIGTTTYVVTAVSNGCIATDTVKIKVPYLYNFFVTPSADSICIGQSVPLTSMLQNVCGVHSSSCATTYTAQIGTASATSANNNITTLVGAFNSSRFQYLYRAGELTASGITGASTITHFGFNVNAIAGNNVYQNFTVKMGCTSQTDLTASYITALQTVFNTKPLVLSAGINYLTLDNTYDWDGVSNIVVEICYNNASTGPNSTVYYSTTTFNSGLYYSANTSACAIATGTTVTTRPTTYFKRCSGAGLSSLVYSWTPSGSLSNDSIYNPIASPTAVTTYVLVATDTVTGCVFSDSSTITASPIFTTTSTNGIVNCTTTGVQINASASPAGTYSYSWSPSSTLSNATIANPMASPPVTTIYTVTVTSAMGCSVTDTVTVSVYVPTLFSFNIIPPSDTICSGSSVALNAIVQKGCGANGSVCGGPVSTSQAGTSALYSNSTGITPFVGLTNSARYQILYLASELAAAGMTQPTTISQLGFNLQSIVGSNSYQGFTIKMGCTSTNSLTTTYTNSLPVVYTAKPTIITNGLNYFTLDNRYDWDGVSNLIIEICFNNAVTSQNSYVYYSTTTYPSMLYSSGASACANASGVTGTGRPNTYFKHCGASGGSAFNYLWTPAGTLSSTTIPNPIASPTTTTTYTLTAVDTLSGCIVSDTARITVLGISTGSINLGNDQTLCSGASVTLNAGSGFTSYQWSTGQTTSSIIASTTGSYWVIGSNPCGTDRDTVSITYYPVNALSLGPNISICQGSAATLTAVASGFTNFIWNTGATTTSIVVSAPGLYWISSSNSCGSGADSVLVTGITAPPSFTLGKDTTLCPGQSILLTAAGGSNAYLWSTGTSGSSITVTSSGQYWVSVSNQCGIKKDTINISYYAPGTLSLGPDITICSGNSIPLIPVSTGFTNFTWSTGATTSSITVNQAGTYWVASTNNCETKKDSIIVSLTNFPTILLGNDTTTCKPVILIPVATNGGTYSWSNGLTTSSIVVNQPGTYWVTLTNACGTDRDTIVVNQGAPPVFSLGNDSVLCQPKTLIIDLTGTGIQYLWQNGSTLPTYTISSSGIYWVTVTNAAGCSGTDTMVASVESPPSIFAGSDSVICKGQRIILSPVGSTTYVWSTGVTNTPIAVDTAGIYIVYTSNSCGTVSDSVQITLEQCSCNLDVPNAFSPNDDGSNDIFYVRGDCDDFILRIYDRWGEKVFETSDRSTGWDGKLKGKKMNSGIYNYYLISRPGSEDKQVIKGNISLIR